ncbi:MAG: type I-E CRISPR-associated protein Cse1/CasA [Pseudomonadales bacterium]|nr:type I-E CRISPR-associated protein Cse1/CasA [Pseudomonadales bacterium]
MNKSNIMNLISDPWLPVQDKAGTCHTIKLSEIGGHRDAHFVEIKAPRADFKGAIYQLLIGILQTAFAPKDSREWKKYWRTPPSQEELEQAFKRIETAFNLNTTNGTPAFMQDFDLPKGEDKNIAALLIEAPGGKTITDNADHFIKRGGVENLSPYWAAIALFTLQINAPSGGVGHRVSLRGGGPLTTLVLPPENSTQNTLWHQLWLNVLTEEEMLEQHGNNDLGGLPATFPWMTDTRTSEKKGMETYPEDAHPLQMYWSMPRRIRLHWDESNDGVCGLSGQQSTHLLHSFHAKNYGVNYTGNWVHSLTPYSLEAGNEPLSIKGQPGGLGYRHWLGLAVSDESGKAKKVPATVVQNYLKTRCHWIGDKSLNPRLWAFGYDMDNMKARCWYEANMPIFNLEGEALADLHDYAQAMVQAAVDVLKTLKSALKIAWFKRPKDAKGDLSAIDANFWSATESEFYRLLAQLAELAEKDDEDSAKKLLISWANRLKQSARELFDQYALSSMNEDGDFKRVIKAKHGKGGLEHYLNGSKALKALAA